MSTTINCPKCGGEMKEGQLYVNVTLGQSLTASYMATDRFPSMMLPATSSGASVEGPSWREDTEKEEGRLIKKRGTRTLPIRGMRCLECGYIEFYVREK